LPDPGSVLFAAGRLRGDQPIRFFALSGGANQVLNQAMNCPKVLPRLLVCALFSCVLLQPAEAQVAPVGKKKVEKADDLPRHTYAVSEAPSVLLLDDAPFAALAAAVRKDMEADLASYDIQDRTTLQALTAAKINLAMLDRDYQATLGFVAELRALQDKPSEKLTSGLTAEAWAKAHIAHPSQEGFDDAFSSELAAEVKALPWDLVENDLKDAKGAYEIRSQGLIMGVAQQQLDPGALKTGTISASVARQLIAFRNQIVNYLPLKKTIVDVLTGVVSAHTVVKPDRWTPRLVILGPGDKASAVRIGIWDSGVDTEVFKDRLITDAQGHHGIAYTLHADPSPDLLFPLGDAKDHINDMIAQVKGFVDLQASVDSPEATDLKRFMSTLKPDQVKPTLENLEMVGNYVHGSHVTGIATEGDPFAQIVIGRITFDYHMIPEVPTVEQARKDAVEYAAVVEYFKQNGVRVVNMSWGGSLKDDEDALEANGAGGTADERKKLARQIFDIDSDGLRDALKSAPGILFVVAAGNSNDNVKFDEFTPSSFQLPNMITVGAVDQAGEETSFSSFGPMVNVHANGYEVESYIPGGKRMKFSGTSMASPQVTNLGAKLFALDPALTPEEAKKLILDGCDKNGRVNLVSEVKSVALLRAQLAAK
jgi:subtilisin family serine protease